MLVSLSTVPAAAVFVLKLETSFYQHYAAFFGAIREKGTLADLRRARAGMQQAVGAAVRMLLKLQGLIALFLCVVARDLVRFLNLEAHWVLLIRVQAVASVGQVIFFTLVLFLLYFDQRRLVLGVVALFLVLNSFLTLGSLFWGQSWFGVGYLVANYVCAILSWILLQRHLRSLEFQTFVKQT
jgi:uncharacterized membrane protein